MKRQFNDRDMYDTMPCVMGIQSWETGKVDEEEGDWCGVQVDVVHRNLLTSDWYDPDHHESLLNTQRYACWDPAPAPFHSRTLAV